MREGADEVTQPRMLVIARESRGMTQGQVAAAMHDASGSTGAVSQGYVSKAEAGRLSVSGDRLHLYARALGYPAALLCLREQEVGAGVGLIHHRKKQAASAGDLKRIHALLNLTRIQLRAVVAEGPQPVSGGIPHISLDDLTTPADAAREARAQWELVAGPLESMVRLIEDAGALVVSRALVAPQPLDSGAESVPVDAVSCCPPQEEPIVLLNQGTPAERQRYTLAHELGHMVLHRTPHPEQEKQADRFAAELLMPAKEIRAELATGHLGIARLLELKARWRVSMWALLRRGHALGVLSDWQYRSLAVEMSSLGYRTTEPGDMDAETPSAVNSIITWHLERGRDVSDLARAAMLSPEEFVALYLSSPVPAGTAAAPHPLSSIEREATS